MHVLRKTPGDEIIVVDGVGGWYRVVVGSISKSSAEGLIVETHQGVGEPPYSLAVALSILMS